MPDVRCAFGLVGQKTRRSSLSPSVSRLLAFWRPFCQAATSSVSSGPLSPARSRVFRSPQDHRHRRRSSAPGPVRATRRPSLVLQRALFSRRRGALPLRSRAGHHSSQRTSPRPPRQAPARSVSRRPAMPSFSASALSAAPSPATHSNPRWLSAFVTPLHPPAPARTPTSTVAPNPGMQRTRCARR